MIADLPPTYVEQPGYTGSVKKERKKFIKNTKKKNYYRFKVFFFYFIVSSFLLSFLVELFSLKKIPLNKPPH